MQPPPSIAGDKEVVDLCSRRCLQPATLSPSLATERGVGVQLPRLGPCVSGSMRSWPSRESVFPLDGSATSTTCSFCNVVQNTELSISVVVVVLGRHECALLGTQRRRLSEGPCTRTRSSHCVCVDVHRRRARALAPGARAGLVLSGGGAAVAGSNTRSL